MRLPLTKGGDIIEVYIWSAYVKQKECNPWAVNSPINAWVGHIVCEVYRTEYALSQSTLYILYSLWAVATDSVAVVLIN